MGVSENPPIAFRDGAGRYGGLAIDLLDHIAGEEGWHIEYTYGAWKNILARLDNGDVDLVVGIGYSQERDRAYDFTMETLVNNWGMIYRSPKAQITSLFDLSGKRIALMTNAIHSRELERTLKEFGIFYLPIYVDDYPLVLEAISDGIADAGAVNRLYSLMYAHDFDVVATTIVFNPVEVRYAAPQGKNADLLATIDRYLRSEKNDPQSPYQRMVERWLKTPSRQPLPTWLVWFIAVVLAMLLTALAFNRMLKREVRVRTEELRRHQQHLEELVKERTSALNTANTELEAFSYSVSHDLRAPLRIITGFSQILLEDHQDKLQGEARDYLQRITNNASRMNELINDLLNLSRISRSVMSIQIVDLTGMAREVIQELGGDYDLGRVDIRIGEGITALGDPNLLRVALTNLLENALKYSGRREHPEVEFGVTERADSICYFVRDNGAGFEMKYADKLFSPFQRLHNDSEFPGTGIGLATVARVIRRHEGRIWAEADAGNGATFYFTLSRGR